MIVDNFCRPGFSHTPKVNIPTVSDHMISMANRPFLEIISPGYCCSNKSIASFANSGEATFQAKCPLDQYSLTHSLNLIMC